VKVAGQDVDCWMLLSFGRDGCSIDGREVEICVIAGRSACVRDRRRRLNFHYISTPTVGSGGVRGLCARPSVR